MYGGVRRFFFWRPLDKIGDPRGGWVGGSKAKKGLGSDLFLGIFLSCF
jgi:hypothetical protein